MEFNQVLKGVADLSGLGLLGAVLGALLWLMPKGLAALRTMQREFIAENQRAREEYLTDLAEQRQEYMREIRELRVAGDADRKAFVESMERNTRSVDNLTTALISGGVHGLAGRG